MSEDCKKLVTHRPDNMDVNYLVLKQYIDDAKLFINQKSSNTKISRLQYVTTVSLSFNELLKILNHFFSHQKNKVMK